MVSSRSITNGRRVSGPQFEGFAVYLTAGPYPRIFLDGRNIDIHIFVWERAHGPRPPRHKVHHKDEDTSNYSLANLELLTDSDHKRLHAGWQREAGVWVLKPCKRCQQMLPLDAFYARPGRAPSALCKRCHITAMVQHRRRHPEKQRLYDQRYYAKKKALRAKGGA